MPHVLRAGDVLADRYRLVDLLAETAGGRFWRAYDSILARPVALHLMAADDPRTEPLMTAARRSARFSDRHLLRVLDADSSGPLCYVVNEWGEGVSLDTLLANEGPLEARHAAWVVAEVAETLAGAHAAGMAHGRLVPENVLLDRAGQVRVIGFGVDAALHGLPPGRRSTDVVDLAGVLYAALTGRWPGVSSSGVKAAPTEQGTLLRPRQVRAGIPRQLDLLCDVVLNPYADGRHRPGPHDLRTAAGMAAHLRDFIGAGHDPGTTVLPRIGRMAPAAGHGHTGEDAAPETEEVPADAPTEVRPAVTPGPPVPVPAAAGAGQSDTRDEEPDPVVDPEPAAETDPEADPEATVAGAVLPAVEEPEPTPDSPDTGDATVATPVVDGDATQAGVPVFDDSMSDVGTWLSPRPTTAPPPPDLPEPAARPLFAPDPEPGEPVRRPRHPVTEDAAPAAWERPDTSSGFIPWQQHTGEVAEDVPGRNWFRLGVVVGVVALIALVMVAAYQIGQGGPATSPGEDASSDTPQAEQPEVVTGTTAQDFDPEGSDGENPADTPLAVDGDPESVWTTVSYLQQLGPAGLKQGVGLIVDLGTEREVTDVRVEVAGGATGASLYLTDEAPTSVEGLEPAGTSVAAKTLRFTFEPATAGRYVTVWLTQLPPDGSQFRGRVAEVVVRALP